MKAGYSLGRKIKYAAITLLLMIAMYLLYTAIIIWNYADVDETCEADAAIVLGAAASDTGISPVFRERINHAILLYQNGYVDKIILTGGVGEGNQHSDAYMGQAEIFSPGSIFLCRL